MKKIALVLAASALIPLPGIAKPISCTFKGVTTFNFVDTGDITNEFPVGTPWTLQVDWDDASSPLLSIDTQSQFRLTKFTLTLRGVSGNWTTSSKPDKPSFTLNYVFSGTQDELQFTSGWGPESHTNPKIENWQPYAINLNLTDPTGTAIKALTPAPSSINLADWDLSKSYFKMYLSNEGNKFLYGSVSSVTKNTAPEISVQQPKGTELADGTTKKKFGTVAVGTTGTARTFTIRNTGTATLSGLKVSVSGSHKADFIVSPLAKTSLAPGTSTNFKISFKPLASGARTAKLSIASNDKNENPFDIDLAGTGGE